MEVSKNKSRNKASKNLEVMDVNEAEPKVL